MDLVHWEDLEGSGGEGGGRGDQDGEHMLTHGSFISMYDKIHYNKKSKKIKKKKNETEKEGVQTTEDSEDMEFIFLHECIKKMSRNGIILTELLLNTSRGPWTPKRTRKILLVRWDQRK